MCKAFGVYPCSHPPTHPWIHRPIYPSSHPSIHQLTRSHVPPSVHPWTLKRTHAHPSMPTSTQPASQPTILASSNQPTSQPIQETIDQSGRLLHGRCRLRAEKRALEPEPNLESIFRVSCDTYIFQHVSLYSRVCLAFSVYLACSDMVLHAATYSAFLNI